MADQDNEKVEETTPPETQETTPPKSQQSSKSSDEEITPERYKGLQKVVAKRDAEILALKEKLDTLAESQEEIRTKTSSTEAEKAKLAKDLADAQALLSTAQAEQAKASKKLAQQTIVLKEFPDLSP